MACHAVGTSSILVETANFAPGVQVPYGAPNPVSTERYLCRWLGVIGAGGGQPLRRIPKT